MYAAQIHKPYANQSLISWTEPINNDLIEFIYSANVHFSLRYTVTCTPLTLKPPHGSSCSCRGWRVAFAVVSRHCLDSSLEVLPWGCSDTVAAAPCKAQPLCTALSCGQTSTGKSTL